MTTIRDTFAALRFAPVRKEIEGPDGALHAVFIRRMTLGEADSLGGQDKDKHSNSVRLLARFIGDEQGAQVFDLTKAEDVQALQGIPVTVAKKILEFGNAVNNPPEVDVEKKD